MSTPEFRPSFHHHHHRHRSHRHHEWLHDRRLLRKLRIAVLFVGCVLLAYSAWKMLVQ